MTILVYCGSEMPARACRRPDVELRDPNGQRQSKKPFNRAPTAIKKQYKFYVRQPDVATFKLGNLSSLMQCSGRRAYNELFFFFRWQLRLSGGSADHFCWYCAFARNKLCSRIVARFADLQGVARIFFSNAGKSVWGDLHLLQLFVSQNFLAAGEPPRPRLSSINVAWCWH